MKLNYSLPVYLIMFIVALNACKKTATNTKQHDYMVGKWRKTRIAIDSNNNGVIENLELHSVTSYDSIHVLVFSGNGTGVLTNKSTNTNEGAFNWVLENNNTLLKLDYTSPTIYTDSRGIDSLSAEAMTLRDDTGNTIVWSMYTKQY